MRPDAARSPNLITDLREIHRRLFNLETSKRGTRTVDALATDWTPTHPNYLEPTAVAPWLELRLKNTTDGIGQIWRAVPTEDNTDPLNPIVGALWRRQI